MPDRIVTIRELNRATLTRQLLAERTDATGPEVIERLVGLQAQAAMAPYVGLWTRIDGFARTDLADTIAERTVVKAAWIRGTLHLVTADDYRRTRAALQPMLSAGWADITKRRGGDVDVDAVVAAARKQLAAEPMTFAELSDWIGETWPDEDVGSIRHAVRMHLPIVQVPVDKGWGYPAKPQFTLADEWLGAKVPTKPGKRTLSPEDLVRRYLAAFGPAGMTDVQAWFGGNQLKPTVEALREELVTYRDEQRTELFDLPDAELPPADQPLPVRFLPEYDNVLLSHRKRTRVVADQHRKRVFLPGLRVAATFLVDGFVAGTWKVTKARGAATLELEPFGKLPKADRDAVAEEGEALARFVEPDAKSHTVSFVKA